MYDICTLDLRIWLSLLSHTRTSSQISSKTHVSAVGDFQLARGRDVVRTEAANDKGGIHRAATYLHVRLTLTFVMCTGRGKKGLQRGVH